MRAAMPTALLLAACASTCAEAPEAFQPVQQELSSFQSLEAALAWSDPSTGARSVVEVVATEDTVVLEMIQGGDGEVAWSRDRGVRAGADDFSVPVPSLNPQAAELWEEVRDGLRGSRWSTAAPPSRAPLPDPPGITWAEVDLPFDWARNVDITLGVDAEGQPRHLVLETREPPLAVTAQMLRGGPRTVTLSETGRLWLVVDRWETR